MSTATVRMTKTIPSVRLRPVRLRLTRRGRAFFTAVVAIPLVVVATAFVLNGGMATASGEPSTSSFERVTVSPGESLWQLAQTLAPASDPREVISDIVQLNQLAGTDVHPGQQLAVPARYSR